MAQCRIIDASSAAATAMNHGPRAFVGFFTVTEEFSFGWKTKKFKKIKLTLFCCRGIGALSRISTAGIQQRKFGILAGRRGLQEQQTQRYGR